jgi:hypothetical protein
MRVSWTTYRFTRPRGIAEEDFFCARLYPGFFRRARFAALVRPSIGMLARVVGIAAIAALIRIVVSDSSSSAVDAILLFGGVILGAAWGASALSFAAFALHHAFYWERVIRVAKRHDDAESFARELVGRRLVRVANPGDDGVERLYDGGRAPTLGHFLSTLLFAVSLALVSLLVFTAMQHGTDSRDLPSEHAAHAVDGTLRLTDSASLRSQRESDAQTAKRAGEGPLDLDSLLATPDRPVRHRPEPGPLNAANENAGVASLLSDGIQQVFDEEVDLLRDYELPASIRLRSSACGRAGSASYDRARHTVGLCSEFVERVFYTGQHAGVAFPAEYARDVARFAVGHELGHALIQLYRLPVLGRNEDAADQFAAMFFLSHRRPSPLISAAMDFGRTAFEGTPGRETWGDEHALDAQREANLVCWLYGSDSTHFSEIAEMLPVRRRENCNREYSELLASWNRLLGPYRRPE